MKEVKIKEKSIQNKEDYLLTENITRWVDKFGVCSDVLEEAKERKAVLVVELRNKDTELIDILHIIEIEPPKDLYNGWKLYKQIKTNRKERRLIKDELLIVEIIESGYDYNDFVLFYFSKDYSKITSKISSFFPESIRVRLPGMKRDMTSVLSNYIRSYVILAFITFAEIFSGLLILGVENAFTISVK